MCSTPRGGAQPQPGGALKGGPSGEAVPGSRLFDDLQKRGQLTNGALSWPGFTALCKQIGWDEKTAGILWRQVDADGGGSLDRREFLIFASRPDVKPYLVPFENRICGFASGGQTTQAALPRDSAAGGQQLGARLFDHLQRSGQVVNGALMWPAFLALCQQVGWDQKCAAMLWHQVDADKGGSIDRREFLTFAARPDVSPYIAPFENRVCSSGGPPMGQPVAPAQAQAGGSAPGQRLWNQMQAQGKIVGGMLSWTNFAPLCAQIGWPEGVGRLLWDQTDVDKSGTLELREFLTFANRPDVKPYLVPFEDRVTQGPQASQFPQQQLSQQQQQQNTEFGSRLFEYLDNRGQKDGVISWAEFVPLCQAAGWDPDVARVLWQDADTMKSGTLSRAQFIAFVNRPDVKPVLQPLNNSILLQQAQTAALPPGPCQPGLRLFDFLDGKGSVRDGVLSWAEFAPLCAQIGWNQMIARQLWMQTDVDNSGTLSREEFLQFASRPDVRPYLIPLEHKLCGPQSVMGGPQMGGPQMGGPQMGSPMGGPMGGPPMGAPMGQPPMGMGQPMGYGTMRPAPGQPGGPQFLGQMGPQQSFAGRPMSPGFGPQSPPISPRMGPYAPMGGMMGQPPMGGPMGQPPMGAPMGQPPMGAAMGQPPMGAPMGQPPYMPMGAFNGPGSPRSGYATMGAPMGGPPQMMLNPGQQPQGH